MQKATTTTHLSAPEWPQSGYGESLNCGANILYRISCYLQKVQTEPFQNTLHPGLQRR